MQSGEDLTERVRARFGAFEADLASGELFRDGKRVAIQEKPFALLSLLLRNQSFTSRDELFAQLWPNVFVQRDLSINTAVRRLRIALEDDAVAPRMIETVGSRGYRLKVAVEWLPAANRRKPAERKRLGVVPFANLNSQPGDFFSEGLTEEMIAHLERSGKNIAVIAPMPSWHKKHGSHNLLRVAQQLRADFVLSGTVSRMDGSLRVIARLMRASDQSCVWTGNYVREDENFLAAQQEISINITREMMPALPD